MKMFYEAKYRQPGAKKWITVKRVMGDILLPPCRCLHLEDDTVMYISAEAEIIFSPHRQKVIEANAEAETGQQIKRAQYTQPGAK